MLEISLEDKEVIQGILKTYAPDCDVYAFGSRATGKMLKKFSDLDLVVLSYSKDKKVAENTLSNLKEAFTESNLPFRVDVILWNDLSDEFRQLIEQDLQQIQEAKL